MASDTWSHKTIFIVFWLLAWLVYIVLVIFNSLAMSGAATPQLFLKTKLDVIHKYEIYLRPADFTFLIWPLILGWAGVTMIIVSASLFSTHSGGRVYLSPPFLSWPVLLCFTFNFIFNIAWLFTWDREQLINSTVFLFLMAATNMVAMAMLGRNLSSYSSRYLWGQPMFYWGMLYRVITNGLGVYTAWTFIAALLNLCLALVHRTGAEEESTCTTILTIIVVAMVLWFVVENTLADKFFRFLITPYMVVMWVTFGISSNKRDDPFVPQKIKDYVLGVLILASIILAIRAVIITVRAFIDWFYTPVTVNSYNDTMYPGGRELTDWKSPGYLHQQYRQQSR